MKSMFQIVKGLLAHHLQIEPSSIRTWQRLDEDLDLTPLELVLIALEVEEIEGAAIPLDALDRVGTVAEFVQFLSRASAQSHRRVHYDSVA